MLAPRADCYAQGHPTASDTLLAIEVSETTLRYDSQVKRALYARHGVPEFWIFDTQRQELRVYRNPDGPEYGENLLVDRAASMQITKLPGLTVDLATVFDSSSP